MRFLFHAVTHTNGALKYWNIYLADKSCVWAEDLSKIHPAIKFKIKNFVIPNLTESEISQNSVMTAIVNSLEKRLAEIAIRSIARNEAEKV